MQNSEFIKFQESSLETIDVGLFKWVNDSIDVHTKTNKGIYKVPVLWLGTERIYQIKNDSKIRDKVGN